MPKDFTIETYTTLMDSLLEHGYAFQTYLGYIEDPAEKVVILRHDIDDRKNHALAFARMQQRLGITGTYYFRMVPQSFDEVIIRRIESMGHEIGYHYEEMDTVNGDVGRAYELARSNLNRFRKIAKIKTICMHGSPLSPYDNKLLWSFYDYREHGIVAEPYFDLDFSKVLYLTDTGRRWDGDKVSVRDHVQTGLQAADANDKPASLRHTYRSTFDIIKAIRRDTFPPQVMMTFHPQRWTDDPVLWSRELITQKAKNEVKRLLILLRQL